MIDPTTTKEEIAPGMTRVRPGGITTSAVLDGKTVPIDIGITSQAQGTPGDPVHNNATSDTTRITERRTSVQSSNMEPGGQDAQELINGVANMSKNTPGAKANSVRRLQHEISIQCHIRLVSMIQACIPPPTGEGA